MYVITRSMPVVPNSFAFVLSSDGSGSPLQSGGSAAIIDAGPAARKLKVAGYLGPATGNEAELAAGLLGLAAIKAVFGSVVTEWQFGNRILWQTDSQYLLRTIHELKKGRVKNSSMPNHRFWHAVSECWSDFSIEGRHVRARSGHRRNEACDQASKWVQRDGVTLLEKYGETLVGRLKTKVPAEAWQLFDLSALVQCLRTAEEAEISVAVQDLVKRLQSRLGQFS